MVHFVILAGIPGCGKSTWAENMLPDHIYVSTDAIRAELGDVNSQDQNDLVFKTFHDRISQNLDWEYNVVADSTALDRRSRRELVDIGRLDGGIRIHLVYFSNCDQAIHRNSQRERYVPPDVMIRMLDKFEYFKIGLPQERAWYDTVTEIRSTS